MTQVHRAMFRTSSVSGCVWVACHSRFPSIHSWQVITSPEEAHTALLAPMRKTRAFLWYLWCNSWREETFQGSDHLAGRQRVTVGDGSPSYANNVWKWSERTWYRVKVVVCPGTVRIRVEKLKYRRHIQQHLYKACPVAISQTRHLKHTGICTK